MIVILSVRILWKQCLVWFARYPKISTPWSWWSTQYQTWSLITGQAARTHWALLWRRKQSDLTSAPLPFIYLFFMPGAIDHFYQGIPSSRCHRTLWQFICGPEQHYIAPSCLSCIPVPLQRVLTFVASSHILLTRASQSFQWTCVFMEDQSHWNTVL